MEESGNSKTILEAVAMGQEDTLVAEAGEMGIDQRLILEKVSAGLRWGGSRGRDLQDHS